MTPFKELYPRAYKCSLLVDTPDKVKKFLVGRQFFVIFVVRGLLLTVWRWPYFDDVCL